MCLSDLFWLVAISVNKIYFYHLYIPSSGDSSPEISSDL